MAAQWVTAFTEGFEDAGSLGGQSRSRQNPRHHGSILGFEGEACSSLAVSLAQRLLALQPDTLAAIDDVVAEWRAQCVAGDSGAVNEIQEEDEFQLVEAVPPASRRSPALLEIPDHRPGASEGTPSPLLTLPGSARPCDLAGTVAPPHGRPAPPRPGALAGPPGDHLQRPVPVHPCGLAGVAGSGSLPHPQGSGPLPRAQPSVVAPLARLNLYVVTRCPVGKEALLGVWQTEWACLALALDLWESRLQGSGFHLRKMLSLAAATAYWQAEGRNGPPRCSVERPR